MKNLIFTLLFTVCFSPLFAQDGEFHLDKTYKISKTGTIELSSSDANVFITGSNRSDVHVKIDRKVIMKGWYTSQGEFTVEVTGSDGDLKIKERQEGVNGGVMTYYKEDYKIEIEAPEGVSLLIRGDDGDYYVKNVNGSISMNIDDADAELTNCDGDKFSFRIDDGDIRMDKAKGSLEISADDADIEIYKAAFTSIHARIDDGDLVIETSLSDKGDYNLESEDGMIAMNITGGGGEFEIRHDDGNVVTQGNFTTKEESESRTTVLLDKGNAKVSLRADDARVKLSAN